MADQQDLEIVIEEDKKPEEIVAETVKVEPKVKESAKAIAPEAALEEMKQSLATERNGRLAAERNASAAFREAHAAKVEAQDSNLNLVTNAIELAKQSQEALKLRYRQARENGDLDAEVEINSEMAATAARLLALENGKAAMEAAPKPEEPKETITDPVEALAAQLTPRSAAWVRSHPQFARDGRLYQRMLAAHNLAVTDGLEPDSDDYFSAIEDTLKVTPRAAEETVDPSAAAAVVTQRRSSPPAAPVTRSGEGPVATPTRVTLTADEVEMAGMMGMTPVEYAKNKMALQKEGKLH